MIASRASLWRYCVRRVSTAASRPRRGRALVHKVSGRWRLGLALAVLTAACWGVLPVALAILLHTLDAYTLTWIRFVTASLGLGGILVAMGRLPALGSITR